MGQIAIGSTCRTRNGTVRITDKKKGYLTAVHLNDHELF